MIDLELTAKLMFERFGERETGHTPNWNYLNEDRKTAWIKEVFEIIDETLQDIRSEIKPIPDLSPHNSTYAMGRNDGIKEERTNLIALLEQIHLDLQGQI